MRRTLTLSAALAVVALAVSAVASSKVFPVIKLEQTRLGKIIVGGDGFTVYLFTKDPKSKSDCQTIKGCESVWTPVAVDAKPVIGPGLERKLVGTIPLPKSIGGGDQVTYNGHPLYTYSGDTGPGHTNYVGVKQFGGKWYAVNAAGNAVK